MVERKQWFPSDVGGSWRKLEARATKEGRGNERWEGSGYHNHGRGGSDTVCDAGTVGGVTGLGVSRGSSAPAPH